MTGVDPVVLTEYAVIFSVVALPLTYVPILLVANDRAYMGRYGNGRLANVLGLVYLVVIMAVALTRDPVDDPDERGPELSRAEIRHRTARPRPPTARQERPPLRQRRRPRDRRRRGRGARGRRDPRRARLLGPASGLDRTLRGLDRRRRQGPRRLARGREDRLSRPPEARRDLTRPRLRRRPAAPLPRENPGSRQMRTLSSFQRSQSRDRIGTSPRALPRPQRRTDRFEAPGHRSLRRPKGLALPPRDSLPRPAHSDSLAGGRPDRRNTHRRSRRRDVASQLSGDTVSALVRSAGSCRPSR